MKFRVYMDEDCEKCHLKFKCVTGEKEKCRDLVSSHWNVDKHMPGVGEVIEITKDGKYICEHNGIKYKYAEDEIYEYDSY